jgi:hypothetical protein
MIIIIKMTIMIADLNQDVVLCLSSFSISISISVSVCQLRLVLPRLA